MDSSINTFGVSLLIKVYNIEIIYLIPGYSHEYIYALILYLLLWLDPVTIVGVITVGINNTAVTFIHIEILGIVMD